jgi:hypothetical protein
MARLLSHANRLVEGATMRWRLSLVLLLLGMSRLSAQDAGFPLYGPGPYQPYPGDSALLPPPAWNGSERPPLASDREFSNFIGFMSNPLQNIDPRSLTQVVPLFLSSWVSTGPALPDLNAQAYGPAISVALTDRLSVGLNQGGYAFVHIDRADRRGPLRDLIARTRGDEFGGSREGFLNLGGYVQYTIIRDVENQFLATAGLRAVAPWGSYEVFQGKGNAHLAPYITVGKELGDFHVLATAGYQFSAHANEPGTDVFYLNAHLDRQFFGWVYPLVEVNWSYHTTTVPIALPTRQGYIDFDNFVSTGNIVTGSAGVNLVLVRNRLELGGAYTRSLSTQRNIDINSMIVKMVFRY